MAQKTIAGVTGSCSSPIETGTMASSSQAKPSVMRPCDTRARPPSANARAWRSGSSNSSASFRAMTAERSKAKASRTSQEITANSR